MADLIPPRRHSRIQLRERYPGIGQGVEPNALKSLGSDPDDHEGLAIDVDDGSQDAGIAVESSPPESAAKGWDTLPAPVPRADEAERKRTSCSGWATGRCRNNTTSTRLKTAALTPMPSESTTNARISAAGLRSRPLAPSWRSRSTRPSSSLHAKPQVVSQATPSGRSSLRSGLSCSTLNMLISNK
jgi:hypothetical protein